MYFTVISQRVALTAFVSVLALAGVHSAAAQSSESLNGGGSSYYSPMGSYSASYGFSSTAFEGAQRGRAALVDAWGNFAVNEAQAAILWQQARALDRDNDIQQTVALFTRRQLIQRARDAERQASAARDAEGQLRFAQLRATVYRRAYTLSADELNPTTGEIHWPAALQAKKYECQRQRLEQLFHTLASYPDPQPQVVEDIGRQVDSLVRSFRSDAENLPRAEYLAAHTFLRGLKYVAG